MNFLKSRDSKQIAFLISGDFPEGNTKNARLKIFIDGLRKHQWEPAVFSAYPSRFADSLLVEQQKYWNSTPVTFFSISRKYWKHKPFRLVQVLISHVNLLCWTLLFSHKYDAFYYYNPRFSDTLSSLLLLRILGRKVIVDQTELFSSAKNKKIHTVEERLIARYSSSLLVISDRLLNYYQKFRPKKIHRFPIVVDFSRFNVLQEEQKYLIGYIGSFAAKDGINMLLDGVKIAQRKIPQLRLRLVGYNPNSSVLHELCASKGMCGSVEITGTVAYAEIPYLLKACDTLLMNRSKDDFSTYGYPIKLGEYFACQKLVVMSDGLGFSQEFVHGSEAFKFEQENADALAEVLIYRYENMEESHQIASRGFTFAQEHFNGDKMVKFLNQILEEV